MRKLIFLHGSGSDKNAYHDLMNAVAGYYQADLITFNAPFKHPKKTDKYTWFNKVENAGRRDAVPEEYAYSLRYIKEQLDYLQEDSQNIILLGHSQGGGMAVHVGLERELKCVISINGDLPYNLSYQKRTNTPVYWFESGQDTYIDLNRKKSYQLIERNTNFHFLRLENSTHTDFKDDFLKAVYNGTIKF